MLEKSLPVVRVNDRLREVGILQLLLGRVPKRGSDTTIYEHVLHLRHVVDVDHARRHVDDLLHESLIPKQRLVVLLSLRYVARNFRKPTQLSALITQGSDYAAGPETRAVSARLPTLFFVAPLCRGNLQIFFRFPTFSIFSCIED